MVFGLKYMWPLSSLRGQERTGKDDSEGESSSSETYEEFIDDDQSMQLSDGDSKEKKKMVSVPRNLFYPPLSSVATSPAIGEAGFFSLDPTDDFVQMNTPFKSADSQQMPTSFSSGISKGSTLYKNELQMNCQRRGAKMPIYTHDKEGPGHALKFRAAVDVDGDIYESSGTYSSKGEAEQAAAKVALCNLRQRQACQDSTVILTTAAVESASMKISKARGKLRNCDGLTCKTPIDLTMDEQSIGSSPPLSTASSPKYTTPLQSASSSHEYLWRGFNSDSVTVKGALKSSLQRKTSSECGAVPAGLNRNNHVPGMEVRFSELQVSRNGTAGMVQATQCTGRWNQFVEWPHLTQNLLALGKLDFSTQAFPLLTRLEGRTLEEVYTVKQIEDFLHVPPNEVDKYLWTVNSRRDGPSKNCPPFRRLRDPRTLLYECIVNPKGEIRFKVSINNQGSTLLQRELGFDRVLRVFFTNGPLFSYDVYKRIAKTGIFVGSRLYQYFVHKPSDDISNADETRNTEGTVKCYFVCPDSTAERDVRNPAFRRFTTAAEVRTRFMHIHNCPSITKYIARLQLCLSKSITIQMPWADLVFKEMEDIPCKDATISGALFTDGTGFISRDLAKKMPPFVFKGTEVCQENEIRKDIPTLVQVRFFKDGAAHKGTLLINDELAPNTIAFHNSMKKVEHDSDPTLRGFSINSFELVSTSRYPRCPARLSRDLILLLSIGGVPELIFLEAVENAIEQVPKILTDLTRAYKEASEWDSPQAEIAVQMMRASISLQEAGLHKLLVDLTKNRLEGVPVGRVPLEGTFYLMGTADPSGTLKPNEVVIFRDDLVHGTVLVYRPPGKHPSDIHKVEAVRCPALETMVGRPKNVIFFSVQGVRPLPQQIAGGDLDGDLYWICINEKVVASFREWGECWIPRQVKSKPLKALKAPKDFSSCDELDEALFDDYIYENFQKRQIVGIASHRWLVHMDAYLHPDTSPKSKMIHEQEFLKYPDYIYEGVDMKSSVQLILPEEHDIIKRVPRAPYLLKKGPQMTKGSANQVKGGRSILGKIYDVGRIAQERWKNPSYGPEPFKVDPDFCVENYEQHMEIWRRHLTDYCREMTEALNTDTKNHDAEEPDRIYMKFRLILYNAASFKESKKDLQKILQEASAIYIVTYERAAKKDMFSNSGSVTFAWRVAGAALVFVYAKKREGNDVIIFDPAVYKELHWRS